MVRFFRVRVLGLGSGDSSCWRATLCMCYLGLECLGLAFWLEGVVFGVVDVLLRVRVFSVNNFG